MQSVLLQKWNYLILHSFLPLNSEQVSTEYRGLFALKRELLHATPCNTYCLPQSIIDLFKVDVIAQFGVFRLGCLGGIPTRICTGFWIRIRISRSPATTAEHSIQPAEYKPNHDDGAQCPNQSSQHVTCSGINFAHCIPCEKRDRASRE